MVSFPPLVMWVLVPSSTHFLLKVYRPKSLQGATPYMSLNSSNYSSEASLDMGYHKPTNFVWLVPELLIILDKVNL